MTISILPNESRNEYNGALTREQFLFHEMRVTAKLMVDGLSDSEILSAVTKDNLFQLPTERSVNSLVKCCLKRLHALDDADLVQAVIKAPSEDAKQICLYAMIHHLADQMISIDLDDGVKVNYAKFQDVLAKIKK